MNKIFTNINHIVNLYSKMSKKSEVITQMIYGDSFYITKKKNKWLKIKIKEDNYKGFIQNKNFIPFIKPTHKVQALKVQIYKFPNKKTKKNKFTFGSKIKALEKKNQFIKFKNGWIYQKYLKPISYKEKNIFNKITLYKNVKYKWGGKSFKGIDCSALVQVCLNFNNKFFPRDTKDQIKYLKKNVKLKNIKKNDLLYWKGHVAVAITRKKLIHAYGPMKKTLIMNINDTISLIQKTAKLKLISIKRLNW